MGEEGGSGIARYQRTAAQWMDGRGAARFICWNDTADEAVQSLKDAGEQ